MFALHVSNPSSDIKGDVEIKAETERLRRKMVVASACRKATFWQVPSGPDAARMMLGHILQYICTFFEHYGLFEKCRHTPPCMRSSVWENWLLSADLKVLFASACCKTRFPGQRSTIRLARTGNGMFASRNLKERGLVGMYYGSLAYADFAWKLQSRKQYWEGYV